MATAIQMAVFSFPSARIEPRPGALPVEVSLIAQLGHGAGDQVFEGASARQKAHTEYIDELDEPSARLGGTDLAKGDATSVFTFAVNAKGHPFHRHAGHRVFTAISGSGGAQLRFAGATREQIELDPASFIRSLQYINIPPDSLFTVRFGGDIWHQFAPLDPKSSHPAFFALSCHTNELGGLLAQADRNKVAANEATIATLTEVLPSSVALLLQKTKLTSLSVPTITLSLDAAPGTFTSALCSLFRRAAGRLRRIAMRWRSRSGFFSHNGSGRIVEELETPLHGSLLLNQLPEFQHDDTFRLTAGTSELPVLSASYWLAAALEGFMQNPPQGVSRLMTLRNFLVRPLGLRTSTLGCPASSLLSHRRENLFAGRYPVLDQYVNPSDRRAQVILGGDDKHLRFRSCVGVDISRDGCIEFTLGTRVQCTNFFGRIYMAAIKKVHRGYVTPMMLRMAVDYAAYNHSRGLRYSPSRASSEPGAGT